MELLAVALELLRRFVHDQKRFRIRSVNEPRTGLLLSIGDALRPLEYAVVETNEGRLRKIVEGGHYGQEYAPAALEFVREIGPDVVTGVYRASAHSPANVFIAHREFVHDAALIAMGRLGATGASRVPAPDRPCSPRS